jgi:rod shape-determining protein MreD
MSLNKPQSLGIFFISIFFAMLLKIAPLSPFFSRINPDWVLLTMIYWTLTAPRRTGVFSAWSVGLLTDVLTGRLLGQYALSYSIAIYFCSKNNQLVKRFPLIQQGLLIFFLQLLSQLLIFWTENFHSATRFTSAFWSPVITGTLFWPIVYTLLSQIRPPKK